MDISLNRTFEYMRQEMMHIIRDDYAAEWVFWYNVHVLMCQSRMENNSDCFGMLKYKVMNRYSSYRDFYFSEEDPNTERMRKKLCFSDSMEEIGTYWKELFAKGDIGRIRAAADWLHIFQKDVMPTINDHIAEFEQEYESWDRRITPDTKAARSKDYRAYKAMLKRCQQKMETYCEIQEMLAKRHAE